MQRLITGARLLDLKRGIDGLGWVRLEGDCLAGWGLGDCPDAGDGLDARGKILSPGFVDTHVHFREPGGEHKETLETGCRAAARGGYTAVVPMANTSPAIDSPDLVRWEVEQGRNAACRLFPAGAVTLGLKGKVLTDFRALKEAGAVCLSDDGYPIVDEERARQAYLEASKLGLRISIHPENPCWGGDRTMHRGELSARLGLEGVSPLAEEDHIARDLRLAEETGAAVMVQHVSTARGADLIRQAKARGVNVTAEATPHHMTLTVEAVEALGSDAKMSPPLRPEEDRAGVLAAFLDGTLDCLATDHAPHAPEEKALGLAQAPNGVIGLETAFAVMWTLLADQGDEGLKALLRGLTLAPRQALDLPDVGFFVGSPADFVLLDLDAWWDCDVSQFASKGRNCPWKDRRLRGKPVLTLCRGEVTARSES